MRSLQHGGLLVSLVLAGACVAPPPTDRSPSADDGRPTDWSSTRLATPLGDRASFTRGIAPPPLSDAIFAAAGRAGWDYDLKGPVDGGLALFNQSTTTGTCGDRLFVPVNRNGASNLFQLTDLYDSCPDHPSTDCDPSGAGHCPAVRSIALDGAIVGGAVSLDFSGARAYVATSRGKVFAIDTATMTVAGTFDANQSLGVSDATFRYASPWVDYATGEVYVACAYAFSGTTATRGRLFKLSPTVALRYGVELQTGNIRSPAFSSPILWNGFVYVTTWDGRIYRFSDTGTGFTQASPWPVFLSQSGINNSPSIDVVNDFLFTVSGDRLYLVELANAGVQSRSVSSQAGINPNTSNAFVDLEDRNVFVGHEGRLWRVPYNANGSLPNSGTNRAVRVNVGGVNDDPRSSPLVFSPAGTKYVYIGDAGGYLNRFDARSLGNRVTYPAGSTPIAGPIDGSISIDYVAGFIYFGSGAGSNKIHQVRQTDLQ